MKNALSLILSVLLVVSCLAIGVSAAEETTAEDTTAETTVADTTQEDAGEEIVQSATHITMHPDLLGKNNIIASTNGLKKGNISKTGEWPGLKIEISDPADPFVSLNYTSFTKKIGVDPVAIETAPFIVFKVLTEDIFFDDLEIYYCAGEVIAPTEEARTGSDYAFEGGEGVLYFIYDLTDDASGELHSLRIDPLGADEGVLMYLTEILFFATEDEALAWCDYVEPETEEPTTEQKTEKPTEDEEDDEIVTAAPIVDDGKDEGCGGVMSATFATLALIALGAVCIKKRD